MRTRKPQEDGPVGSAIKNDHVLHRNAYCVQGPLHEHTTRSPPSNLAFSIS